MSFYMPSSLRRLHQLNGPNGIRPTYSVNNQINFKFEDVPQTMTALGRKHVNYMAAVRLEFDGVITSTGGVTLKRKVLTPALIQSVQIQGTEIGTPVSSSHMLGGAIDTDTYIRSGGRNPTKNPNGFVLAAGVGQPIHYSVDIMLGNFSQKKGHETCPLALFMRPGEIFINTPVTTASVDSSLADVVFSAMSVTAHAVLIPDTNIRIANPWQMTRHKATAGAGTDSVMLNSFGANSTLTGVQSRCGLHSILWAGSGLIGDAKGPGTVASITQFAADFLGLRQNNDPRAIVQELYEELTNGQAYDVAGAGVPDILSAIYPMFDLANPAVNPIDLLGMAEYFPILFPVRDFDASKMLDAVGNPSYDLTGTFTPGASHYSYVEGCYPFTMDKLNDLVAVIQRSHLALELYGTDDVVLTTKLADNQDLLSIANSAPEKLSYLPRSVIPRASAAVK
jgi:hypothetical protein